MSQRFSLADTAVKAITARAGRDAFLVPSLERASLPPQKAEPIVIASLPPVNVVMPTSGPPVRKWTCAAFCVSSYNCKASGDSESVSKTVSSEGDSAAAAFMALADQCKGAHADLGVHGDCASGKWESVGAAISTSCAH